jgi:hypothetical protein
MRSSSGFALDVLVSWRARLRLFGQAGKAEPSSVIESVRFLRRSIRERRAERV